MPLPALLIALSALIIGLLGTAHLLLTFVGTRLHPRDPAVREAMASSHPQLTRRTTMWQAWVGFNASHSYCGMLYALVYGGLAITQPQVLLGSTWLLGVGLALLLALTHLGLRYWFRSPLTGILLALGLYLAGLLSLLLGR